MMRFSELCRAIDWQPRPRCLGRVIAVKGAVVLARIPHAAIGEVCVIERRRLPALLAQVVSFSGDLSCLVPFDPLEGISPNAIVSSSGAQAVARIRGEIRGRILDALGNDVGGAAAPSAARTHSFSLSSLPPTPLERRVIDEQFCTGIRCIDGLCPIGYGQRMGVFAGAGVGKSMLLGMIARNARADVSVIALVGERGREVQDFISDCLGHEGLARSVVVAATSDESPLRRRMAPQTATAIAEYFRDQGLKVLLLVDSLTRTARAIREVELAAGEIPVRQGYTSGVFTELPRLLERAGNTARGSITAIYTVLTSGESEQDALGEEIKSILDGHLVLDGRLAQQGLRPAIDALRSTSRLAARLLNEPRAASARIILKMLARLRKDKDIVLLGGAPDPELQAALDLEAELHSILGQTPHEASPLQETFDKLYACSERFHDRSRAPARP